MKHFAVILSTFWILFASTFSADDEKRRSKRDTSLDITVSINDLDKVGSAYQTDNYDLLEVAEALLNRREGLQNNLEKVNINPEIGSVTLDIFYSSLCNDSRVFIHKELHPVVNLLEKYLRVNFIPYGKTKTLFSYPPEYYKFSCQRGAAECYGDKLHACAIDEIEDEHQSLHYVLCLTCFRNTGLASDDDAARRCKKEGPDIDYERIIKCAKSKRSNLIYNYYGELTKPLNVKYIPHVHINGVPVGGDNLLEKVCDAFIVPPEPCKKKPNVTCVTKTNEPSLRYAQYINY